MSEFVHDKAEEPGEPSDGELLILARDELADLVAAQWRLEAEMRERIETLHAALHTANERYMNLLKLVADNSAALKPQPMLLVCPSGKCTEPARECFGSGCIEGPNVELTGALRRRHCLQRRTTAGRRNASG